MTNSKPSLFNTPTILALFNTKPGVWPAEPIDPIKLYKSQTRRLDGLSHINELPDDWVLDGFDENSKAWHWHRKNSSTEGWGCISPYPAGQHRWVKEGYAQLHEGLLQKLDPDPNHGWRIVYKADGEPFPPLKDYGAQWQTPLFMRKEYARLHLEVVESRPERLQAISEEDAQLEGIAPPGGWMSPETRRKYDAIMAHDWGDNQPDGHYRTGFRLLWDSINGKKKRDQPWSRNPWVWRVVIRRKE